MTPVLVITGNCELDPNWKAYTIPITAPSNYKDPNKISEYIKQKTDTLQEDVYSSTGCISRFTDIHMAFTTGYSTCGLSNPEPERDIMIDILRTLGNCCYGNTPIYVVGYGVPSSEVMLRSLFRDPFEDSKFFRRIDTDQYDPYTIAKNCYEYVVNGLAFGTTFIYKTLANLLFTSDECRLLNLNNWLDYNPGTPRERLEYIVSTLVENSIIPRNFKWLKVSVDDTDGYWYKGDTNEN